MFFMKIFFDNIYIQIFVLVLGGGGVDGGWMWFFEEALGVSD
jgi:hypothetical protein